MNAVETVHEHYVKRRRVDVLASLLVPLLPDHGTVLDIGSGDGELAAELMHRKPGLSIQGIDPLVRPDTAIPVTEFDGFHIPFDDNSFDYCLFVDVLHHAGDPVALLAEAARVSKTGIVIKDHLRDGFLAGPTLRFMDIVGNGRFGVSLPYTYWSTAQWQEVCRKTGLTIEHWESQLKMYPAWGNWIFGRRLHLLARFGCK